MTEAAEDKLLLPQGFEALSPFVAEWAIATLTGRIAARSELSAAGRAAFYSVAAALLEPALDYLDSRPRELPDPSDARLMQLMQSLAHVALAEEVQREDEPMHAVLRSFMPITRVYP